MDPITQGALGTALPQPLSPKWLKQRKYHVVLSGFLKMILG